jgi:MarR family transcriptional regulator, 2-MHQ and catechol-resistance regulon repressor
MATKTSPVKRTAAQDRALKLFVVLTRAMNAVSQRLDEYAGIHDLTLTEFGILEALYHKGPLLLGDVQKKILLSSGGVTYTVDRLEEKGLVERRACPTDRRARYAALTAKGTELMCDVFPEHAARIEQLLGGLSAREQDEAISLLRKLGLHAAVEQQ